MFEYLKSRLTQENIAIFLFSSLFWLYSAKMGLYNGIVIITALWGIYFVSRNARVVWQYFNESYFIWIFLLLVIPMMVSILSSSYPNVTGKTIINFVRFFFIGGLALMLLLPSLEKIRYLVLVYIFVISIDAVIEWLTGYHLMGVSRDRVRIMGLFQYYHLGYVLATLTPIVFYQVMTAFVNKESLRYFWLIVACGSVVAIFIAGSRAGVVSLLVSIGLIILYQIFQKKISLKLVLGTLLAVILIGGVISQLPIVKNRYITPYQESEQLKVGSYEWFNKISSDRFVLWEFAWRQYKENPVIGAGSGTFENAFKELPIEARGIHKGGAGFPHFYGLEVLSQTGTLGFICYLLALCSILFMLFTGKQFSVWLAISFLAMMPINLHVSFYGSFWAVLIWVPLILGLREKYLLTHCDPLKKY